MSSEKVNARKVANNTAHPERSFEGTIALGLRVISKWDRITAHEAANGQPCTPQELMNHADAFDSRQEATFLAAAKGMIDDHNKRQSVPKEKWRRGVGQAFVGAWMYTISITLIFFVALFFKGADIWMLIKEYISKP